MTQQICLFCLALISFLKYLNAAFIPLRPLVPTTSAYKPSTLLLPPGFDSQKVPPEPMLYPYAVSSSSGISKRTQIKGFTSGTTPDWIPVAGLNSDLPLKRNLQSTTSTSILPVLEDRISNSEQKYSSPVYKDGPVFETIVYGTWKPDPPLQPLKVLNATYQQQMTGSKSIIHKSTIGDGKVYNKTINRQHGGFIGHIQQKPLKTERQISLKSLPPSFQNKSKDLIGMGSETKLRRKLNKQGRRKIRPIVTTTEENSIEKYEVAATVRMATTKKYAQPQQNVIKVNSTDPKLMEVVKQINESLEIKYNHKKTSTHSIDMMMTTAEAHNEDDDNYAGNGYFADSKIQWATRANEFLSTEPQLDYEDDYNEKEIRNVNATRRSWPTDFVIETFPTTDVNYGLINNTNKRKLNNVLESDPSEIPSALSALNIPPSLWPKLPGNITKLGKPYEAESFAEEPALCIPITVRENNIMHSNDLVYIERIFCFPMPPSTSSENGLRILESTSISSNTLKTVTTAKVQHFDDVAYSNPKASKANCFKNQAYLVASILVIYSPLMV